MPTEHGLSVVKVRPSTPLNYVSNLAEKWALEDWVAENPTIAWMAGNTKLPPGRPKLKDITYPKRPETTVLSTVSKPISTNKQPMTEEQKRRKASETYRENNLTSRQNRRQVISAKAFDKNKATGVVAGRNRAQEGRIADTLNKWESNRRQGIDSNNPYQKEYNKLFKLKAKAESRGNYTLAKLYLDLIRKLSKLKHSDDDNGILNKD